jgi:anoctamin-10
MSYYERSDDEGDNFKVYAIIEFDDNCSQDIKVWLNSRLKAPKEKGGANLSTKYFNENLTEMLLIGCTNQRLLEGAEEIGIRKMLNNKVMCDFSYANIQNFENYKNLENFLTQSECLKIIDHEFQNMKPSAGGVHLTNEIYISEFDPILSQLERMNIVKQTFPIHDTVELKKLEKLWWKASHCYDPTKSIPISLIRQYFGESIGFYFKFFEYYNLSVLPFLFIGLFTWFISLNSVLKLLVCALFNIVWGSLFIEMWKRVSANLCYTWGVPDSVKLDEIPRKNYELKK